MPLPLIALAIASFGIGTTEFVVMGLLPGMAADLCVSIPDAGLVVTAYAAGVVIGAPIMAIATNGFPRKASLLGLMGIFIAGNVLCALAPGYAMLIAARVVTAFCHGAFFGIAAVVASEVVAPNRRARAVALVFAGLTVANIIGVPGGTALGQAFGWRATFWAVAAIGLLSIAAIAAWLPAGLKAPRGNLASEFKVLGRPQVLLAMSITVLTSASLFVVFTFIAPFLGTVTGLSDTAVTGALLLFGIGMTAGSFVGGRLADRAVMATIAGVAAALIGVLATLAFIAGSALLTLATMLVWGLVIFSLAPALQIRVVDAASDAPNVASTLNQAAFNLGNAGGAWIGSAALMQGLDYGGLPWVGVLIATVALAAALLSLRLDRALTAQAPDASTAAV
jgi:MFS transporter, DHA1 family, inner membrane transport protein